ncbi:MAG: RpiB/LacA/LacB family sugar-phosphate isomerase, partial [bacterium]|nr:RpiB/LacA/LacB family sugar-phosphate isomerase [bacterium]
DYPLFACVVAQMIQKKEVDRGILICGSGIGMAVAANRFKGVYAGLVWNEEIARVSRKHDKVNVLVLPSDFISPQEAVILVNAWLETEFLGGRYQDRIHMIDDIK